MISGARSTPQAKIIHVALSSHCSPPIFGRLHKTGQSLVNYIWANELAISGPMPIHGMPVDIKRDKSKTCSPAVQN